MSRLDQLYRRLLLTKFFTKGWGKPDNLKRIFEFRKIMSDREQCRNLVPNDYPIHIDKEYPDGDCRILEGHFTSPFTHHLPGIMPKEVETATFQMILPKQWKDSKHKPMCIHLAGTGDHYFWRRRLLMAKPLLKESGIASILLENPYYGSRKPKGQLRSSLHNVSDLFVMGGALILESLALLHWCQNQGYGPLGLTGISMGGHMASLAATNWPEPVSLIPCLSWSTASVVFTQGVMSGAIPWKTLETQFFENSVYQDEISKMIVSPENYFGEQAYEMGQQFVKDFSSNYNKLQEFHHHHQLEAESPHPLESVAGEDSHSPSHIPDCGKTQTPEGALSMVQASIGGVPHTGGARISSPSLSPSSGSGDSLSLKHAMSKAKLSRSTPSITHLHHTKTDTLHHAVSKSQVSRSSSDSGSSSSSHTLQQEAVNFMMGVMDECTHLGNFSVPVDPRLIIIVAAQEDAYIPRRGVIPLTKLWPGSEMRYLANRGHIAAFLFHNDVFRKAIADSFNRQIKLHHHS
ncbi:protein ABHD18-like [Babylonia areolata]|uniref:protein ABHD18-like n=1 Tax=Babylonia areolata TaxID=304850 RepID=UPI003FCF07EE